MDELSNDEKSVEEDDSQFDLEEKFPEFKGWEAVGFHRALGNELWEVFFELLGNATYILVIIYLVPLLQPYPEIAGYRSVASGLFLTIYMIFDTGTNFGLGRFIAEYRIKNPRKMMEYVKFFMIYQMITGLIQVTILSFILLESFTTGIYAYLIWIMLFELQKQYPGMLGIFKSILSGMQHFNKVQAINWVQGQVVQMFFNIGFILLGRWYGETHPGVGVILGMAIGGVIGSYLDDVIFMFISGYYLNKIMKKHMGFSLFSSFHFKIGKDVYENAVKYGVPGSIVPIISSAVNTFILVTYVSMFPSYTTWIVIVGVGTQFSGVVGQFGDFSLTSNISEAFMNKKAKLAEFYVSYSAKWRYFFMILIGMTILAVIPYFEIMINETKGLEYYTPALLFLLPSLIKRLINPLCQIPDPIMNGAKHIIPYNILRLIEEGIKIFFIWLFMYQLKIQNTWDIYYSVLFLLTFQNYPAYIIKSLLGYIYVNKKILKVKIYWINTIIIPLISALPAIFLARIWLTTGFPPMMEALTFIGAVVVSFILYFVILLATYVPLTILLGAWDEYQFFTFSQAVKISGPSKPIFSPLLKLMKKVRKAAIKIGTFGKFPIPFEEAHKQIEELMVIKREMATNDE
jgi:hypothetical protein